MENKDTAKAFQELADSFAAIGAAMTRLAEQLRSMHPETEQARKQSSSPL